MGLVKSEGIVLKAGRLRETSKIVNLYTDRFGKLTVVAKGALKPGSRFGADLEGCNHILAVIYRREGKEIDYLSSTDILNDFPKTKAELPKWTAACGACELVDKATSGEEAQAQLFASLLGTLKGIEYSTSGRVAVHFWHFVLRLLEILGYRPDFSSCVKCRKRVEEDEVLFSAADGGLVCRNCSIEAEFYHKLSRSTAGKVSLLQKRRSENLSRINLTRSEKEEIRRVLPAFWKYHLGDKLDLKSFEFMEKVAGDRVR
jgi:DNA repair protein RecO (recombination protein O)